MARQTTSSTARPLAAYFIVIAAVVGCVTPSSGREAASASMAAPSASVAPVARANSGGSKSDAPEAVSAEPERPHERFTLSDELGRPIEVYPPFLAEPRLPLFVVLHATCM